MTRTAFFCDNETTLRSVYAQAHRDRIAACCAVRPIVVTSANLEAQLPALADVEAIFTTWGMPALTAEQVARMPALKAVFYAAGSVKGFATPFLERNITVVSAWAANAVPVAEFTLAQSLLSYKGYFRNDRDCATSAGRATAFHGQGNFDQTVALLGAGTVWAYPEIKRYIKMTRM